MTESPFDHESGVNQLFRAIIHQAVTDLRSWETMCHRSVTSRSSVTMAQTTARDALDWLLGDRVDPLRLSFEQCCSFLEVPDWMDVGDKIIAGIDREAIDLLQVPPRVVEGGRWAVSPRPVVFAKKSTKRAGVAPVPVSA